MGGEVGGRRVGGRGSEVGGSEVGVVGRRWEGSEVGGRRLFRKNGSTPSTPPLCG